MSTLFTIAKSNKLVLKQALVPVNRLHATFCEKTSVWYVTVMTVLQERLRCVAETATSHHLLVAGARRCQQVQRGGEQLL